MECTAELATIQQIETPELIENKKITKSKQIEKYEEEARKHRMYLAEQEARRQLERIKTHALVMFKR